MNAYSFLIQAAHRHPNAPACVSAERTVTYGDLLRETEELRDSLIAHGLRPGMGLGLVAQNSAEFIIGLFAGLACEAVVMPLAPDLKEQEFNRTLELVPMAAILHDGSLINKPRFVESSELDAFEILVRPEEFHCKVASGIPRAALIRFTSGTTGSSKGVVLSYTSVSERTLAAATALNIGQGTKILWVLPMAYHFIVSILTYVRYGATIILADSTDPSTVLSTARQHNPDILYGSPALLESLTALRSAEGIPSSTRVISTSTGMSRESISSFEKRFSTKVSQVYGLIEVGLPLGNLEPDRYPPESVGIPMSGYEVAILDPQGRELPAGKIGRLAVRGPGMFDAYLAPYRPSGEALTHGWFLTGDLATLGYDGSVTVCGRERSVIHAHGEKVFPEEVEGVINSFPGVRSSRVFGVQNTNLDEMVIAEIVPTTTTHLDLDAVQAYLSERLSPHKVPSRVVVVPSIPLTQTGKVIRSGWHAETTSSH